MCQIHRLLGKNYKNEKIISEFEKNFLSYKFIENKSEGRSTISFKMPEKYWKSKIDPNASEEEKEKIKNEHQSFSVEELVAMVLKNGKIFVLFVF